MVSIQNLSSVYQTKSKMTRKLRNSSRAPKFLSESSVTDSSRRKYRRRRPQEPAYSGDYVDNSQSQSQSQSESHYESSNEEEELEQPLEDDAASYTDSTDQLSSESPEAVLKSNNFNERPSNLAPDSPNNSQPKFQETSYINVAPLPIFRGASNECPVTHLSRFNKVCRANNVSSIDAMMRIFPVTLEGEAALWYDLNIEPYTWLSWEDMKSSFLEAYHEIQLVDQLRYELMNVNQGKEESVRSYFLRLQWILKRWPDHGMPDNLLKGVFIDGLKEDFQEWIIPQKPESLKEALRLAFAFEQVKGIKGTSRKKNLRCGFCEEQHEESGCEIMERMKELWRKKKEKAFIDLKEKNKTEPVAEDKDDKEEGGGRKKKSQCQCGKHQCWMKQNIERKDSVVSRNSNAE